MNALNEVRILASIRHPNIIGYKEVFIDEGFLWFYKKKKKKKFFNFYLFYIYFFFFSIIMEYADNGDLL